MSEPNAHWENITELADYGETSGGGPWIKLKMKLEDMGSWRGNKGNTYEVTACFLTDDGEGNYSLVKEILWRNEGQMLGFGESDASGCWVKFRVEPRDLDFFRGNKGQYYYWKIIDMDNLEGVINAEQKSKNDKGPYGQDVRRLHTHGFFKSPEVWKSLGTDKSYQACTRYQPCLVTGGVDWDEKKGVGRTEFAHVRRAGDSGTGYKGRYSGVPLVHEIHANYQHRHGETAAYKYYIDKRRRKLAITPELAKAWFDKKAAENVQKWAHDRLCELLGVPSLTMAEPTMVLHWAIENDVAQYLPKNYRYPDMYKA